MSKTARNVVIGLGVAVLAIAVGLGFVSYQAKQYEEDLKSCQTYALETHGSFDSEACRALTEEDLDTLKAWYGVVNLTERLNSYGY